MEKMLKEVAEEFCEVVNSDDFDEARNEYAFNEFADEFADEIIDEDDFNSDLFILKLILDKNYTRLNLVRSKVYDFSKKYINDSDELDELDDEAKKEAKKIADEARIELFLSKNYCDAESYCADEKCYPYYPLKIEKDFRRNFYAQCDNHGILDIERDYDQIPMPSDIKEAVEIVSDSFENGGYGANACLDFLDLKNFYGDFFSKKFWRNVEFLKENYNN